MRRHVRGSTFGSLSATIVLETLLELTFGVAVIVAVILTGRSVGICPVTRPRRGVFLRHPATIAVVAAVSVAVLAWLSCGRFRLSTIFRPVRQGFSVVATPRVLLGVLIWSCCVDASPRDRVLVPGRVPPVVGPLDCVARDSRTESRGLIPLLPGSAGTQQAALAVALVGTAGAGATLGFGVGMQMSTTVADVTIGTAAVTYLWSRSGIFAVRKPSF